MSLLDTAITKVILNRVQAEHNSTIISSSTHHTIMTIKVFVRIKKVLFLSLPGVTKALGLLVLSFSKKSHFLILN